MLGQLVADQVYHFLLVFARLGAILMLLPGLGSQMIPVRVRLIMGLALALLATPLLQSSLPPMPRGAVEMTVLVAGEVTIGIFIGIFAQLLMAAVSMAGTFMSFQSGLANAFVFDPVTAQQSSLLTGFLSNVAILVLFAANLHHLMIQSAIDSYLVFAPGAPIPFADFSAILARTVTESFNIGLRMAAPVIVFGLVFYTGLGILTRLMPQVPVFFVAVPVQIWAALSIVGLALPIMMFVFASYFADGMHTLSAGR